MHEEDLLGSTLLRLARDAIGAEFDLPQRPFERLPILREQRATFVTLKRWGTLRGCIGTLTPFRPLLDDVQENARHAAFRDPRFLPVNVNEFPELRIEVSLLTPPQPLVFTDESEALAQLRPGIDGVVFAVRGQRATFLPQVWEDLPAVRDFMGQLKMKAGLPPDYWSQDVVLERYQVRKWKEFEI